jgi:DNA segregation ATPase FtsK/SpoIIIE, S-DNA-T family
MIKFQMEDEQTKDMLLPIFIGQDIKGKYIYKDFSKAIHLLVSGSSGSGKSVFINALIASLLHAKTSLQFCMIDPKRVELSIYKGLGKDWFFNNQLPITDTTEATQALSNLCEEMDRRYLILQKLNLRNIKEANLKGYDMPYIICIIDEYADLMLRKKEQVEYNVIRMAQLARAVGIHLVLCSQRPSLDVITGLIKANFQSRVAFRTASRLDSRIILDRTGAELLRGNGDMIWQDGIDSENIQGCFISDEELNTIIQAKKKMAVKAAIEWDELTIASAKLCYEFGVNASIIQRKLKLGWNKTDHIINTLIEADVITPYENNISELKMSYTQFLQLLNR